MQKYWGNSEKCGINLCSHLNTVIDRDGSTEICVNCALVIDSHVPYVTKYASKDEGKNWGKTSNESLCFLDILTRLNILTEDNYEKAQSFYWELYEKRKQHQVHGKKPLFSNDELKAFAVWELINSKNIGLSPEHVSYACGVEAVCLWKIQRSILNTSTFQQTSSAYLSNSCYYLKLSYKHEKRIIKICNILDKHFSHFKPINICAGGIKFYCSKRRIRLSFSFICRELGCSPSSVNNLLHLVKKNGLSEHLTNIAFDNAI